MLNELVGKKVTIVMGINESKMGGFDDNVKGEIVEVETNWLKLLEKNKSVYINISQIKRITPQ